MYVIDSEIAEIIEAKLAPITTKLFFDSVL